MYPTYISCANLSHSAETCYLHRPSFYHHHGHPKTLCSLSSALKTASVTENLYLFSWESPLGGLDGFLFLRFALACPLLFTIILLLYIIGLCNVLLFLHCFFKRFVRFEHLLEIRLFEPIQHQKLTNIPSTSFLPFWLELCTVADPESVVPAPATKAFTWSDPMVG